MQAKKRYACLGCLLTAALLLWARPRSTPPTLPLPPLAPSPRQPVCTMDTCFNHTRCRGPRLRVHVYPDLLAQLRGGEQAPKVSELYLKLLTAVRESSYYTADPREACLFLLAYDTSDRDPKSLNFVKNLPGHLRGLDPAIWDGGRNHIVLTLYPGTFPDYNLQELQLDPGLAVLAKASFTRDHLRPAFDIPFPLIHAEIPLRQFADFPTPSNAETYLLTFKGKRYVYGEGSETRNALYHVHNGRDVVLLTTCKHGKDWESLQDNRCPDDNLRYDQWDYEEMMRNASFCLVPRGRRPDSFRFLEALRAPCVPVVLSDHWLPPFHEVIDWSQAVVTIPEYKLFTLPEVLRNIPFERVRAMRLRGQRLYEQYFSSVQRIIFTVFEIMRDRLEQDRRGYSDWNSDTAGALYRLPHLPVPFPEAGGDLKLTIQLTVRSAHISSLQRFATDILRLPYLHKIIILWSRKDALPKFPSTLTRGKLELLNITHSVRKTWL